MRKVVKPAVRCKTCGQVMKWEKYQEFCDFCGKLLPEDNYPLRLEMFDVGHISENHEDADLCSWQCAKNFMIQNKKKLETTDFFALPYIIARNKDSKDYVEGIKEFFQTFVPEESKRGERVNG